MNYNVFNLTSIKTFTKTVMWHCKKHYDLSFNDFDVCFVKAYIYREWSKEHSTPDASADLTHGHFNWTRIAK